MLEITRTASEVEIDYLAGLVKELTRQVEQLADRANRADEATNRPFIPPGALVRRAQVTTAIGSRSGSTQGTGAAKLVVAIGGTLYRQWPNITVSGITNDAKSSTSIALNQLIWIMMVDREWSVLWEDCGETTPSAFADQPH